MILASVLLAVIHCNALVNSRVLPSDEGGSSSTLLRLQYDGRLVVVVDSDCFIVAL